MKPKMNDLFREYEIQSAHFVKFSKTYVKFDLYLRSQIYFMTSKY